MLILIATSSFFCERDLAIHRTNWGKDDHNQSVDKVFSLKNLKMKGITKSASRFFKKKK